MVFCIFVSCVYELSEYNSYDIFSFAQKTVVNFSSHELEAHRSDVCVTVRVFLLTLLSIFDSRFHFGQITQHNFSLLSYLLSLTL